MSTQLTEYIKMSKSLLDITSNGRYNVKNTAAVDINVNNGLPLDIETDTEMSSVLNSEHLGSCYKFIGSTGTYIFGDFYLVMYNNNTSTYYFRHYSQERISNLTNTTWRLSLYPSSSSSNSYSITYTTCDKTFTSFSAPLAVYGTTTQYYYLGSDSSYYYYYGFNSSSKKYGYLKRSNQSSSGIWSTNDAYRTIHITGGSDVTNSTLINWLYNNADLL